MADDTERRLAMIEALSAENQAQNSALSERLGRVETTVTRTDQAVAEIKTALATLSERQSQSSQVQQAQANGIPPWLRTLLLSVGGAVIGAGGTGVGVGLSGDSNPQDLLPPGYRWIPAPIEPPAYPWPPPSATIPPYPQGDPQ